LLKSQYDENGAKAFKRTFYDRGVLIGGCPWDEQFLTITV